MYLCILWVYLCLICLIYFTLLYFNLYYNESYILVKTDPIFFSHLFSFSQKFSRSVFLSFWLFFVDFSLTLLVKVLLIKISVYYIMELRMIVTSFLGIFVISYFVLIIWGFHENFIRTYNTGHNILEVYNVLVQVQFSRSKTKLDI